MGSGTADLGEPSRACAPTVERFGPRGTPGRTILVGVDGSDTARRAAAYAFGLARRQGRRLLVAFVAARSGLALTGPAAAFEDQTQRQLCAELRAEACAVQGDPVTALRDAADHRHADTVVVGASTSAGHRIAGSVATRLIRAGHWPVIVVP